MSKIVANEFLSISKSTIIHFARTQKHIQNQTQQNNAINDKMKTTELCLKFQVSERIVNNSEHVTLARFILHFSYFTLLLRL